MSDAADERAVPATDTDRTDRTERLVRHALNTLGNAAVGAAVVMAAVMLLLGVGNEEVPWEWSVAVAGALTAGFVLRLAADDLPGPRR